MVKLAEAVVNERAETSPADLERLGDEIAELAAHLQAVTYLLLVRLREFDAREGWSGGFRSCAHWLSWRTGIDAGAAREKVRVARALGALPAISRELERGALTYAKARALTRVATSANEAELLEVARHGTASQVEQVVRAWRRVDRLEEMADDRRLHEARSVTLWIDDDGSYVLRGRLTPEAGALLERALVAADSALETETRHGREEERLAYAPAQRRADALALVAADALRAGSVAGQGNGAADRYQVVVHVDADALRGDGERGQSAMAGGPHVSAETSRRLACDGTRVVMQHAAGGRSVAAGVRPVAVTGARRTIPASLRRVLEWRDRGTCRFPGCGNRRCDAHHVRHWADGGATRLDNLVLLCRRHHRAVHEEGWRVVLMADGEAVFRNPRGDVVPDSPRAPAGVGAAVAGALAQLVAEPSEPPRCERMDVGFALLALRE